jgi:hypothetical protein
LLCGAGLHLRVEDLKFTHNEILVRDGESDKDQMTMLPGVAKPKRPVYVDGARRLHDRDTAEGFGRVYLPDALARKYPNADRAWGWQEVFPPRGRSLDPRSQAVRRHPVEPSLQSMSTWE